jgi:BirA family biotin operon repressor/biotin-[acetyl-CoA-carboxylase] ligase
MLVLADFEAHLKTQVIGRAANGANELWDEIESTNTRAAQLAAAGVPEGVVVMARQQTAGRGRQGRTWVSPPDSGIYVSFVLRPDLAPQSVPLMSLATGVAVVDAVAAVTGLQVGLKWVNDIVASGRKLGGILAEMTTDPKTGQRSLVVGVGINVRLDETQPFDELCERVEWLERLAGREIDYTLLVVELAWSLEQRYFDMRDGARQKIVDMWKERSVTLGQEIRATTGNSAVEGTAIDIDENGALVLATVDGNIKLHAGEISIRNTDGSYC